jgi:YD repeat-containing protein
MGVRVTTKLFTVLALSMVSFAALAGVNVNNGNFYIAYTDLLLPTKGINIDVTRTYNSRSNYVKGYFGVGWASEIEGYIVVDGKQISFFEGGGGNVVRFEPAGKGQWKNAVYGPQWIKKAPAGYVLQAANGKNLFFDDAGKLQRIADKNKNFVELVWAKDRVEMLRDNMNNQIRVKWAEYGKSNRIVRLDSGKLVASYEYNNFGDLMRAVGADGVPYAYEYDDEHNMTKISYKDGTFKAMGYNKARDWITKFRDADRMVTDYEYVADTLDQESKFGTTVTRAFEGSKERDVSRYWYEFRKRADGTKYNYKAVTWIRGNVTETLFTECCGTPQVISQWKGEEPKAGDKNSWTVASKDKRSTFFEYYADGLLKKKTDAEGVITELAYDKVHNKVKTVVRQGRKIEYNYDQRGNLATAYDDQDRRKLNLTYDLQGRLMKIGELRQLGAKSTNREVFFRYNESGKPIEIKEKTGNVEGIIKIAYNPNGDVKSILNAQNRAVASEKEFITAQRVASTFQSLLEIVQPAGVTLTPEG